MHYVAYFAIVGSVLLGLLFFADAKLGPPGPMPLGTSFAGIAPPKRPDPGAQILTVREVPLPEVAAMASSEAASAAPILLSAQKKPTINKSTKKQKSKQVARRTGNVYAQTATESFGRVW